MRRTVDVVEVRWVVVDGRGMPFPFRSALLLAAIGPLAEPDLLAIADVDRRAAGRRPPPASLGPPEEDGGC